MVAGQAGLGTVVGNPAAIDPGLQERADETIIAAEIFFDFVPFFGLVMGPTRMPYEKVVTIVDYTSSLVTRMLET